MQLNVRSDFQSSGNIQQSGEFTIRTSPLAFQILSSTLYSNKIAAVIRELACNAADAHIAAGTTDRPFLVKLPDSWDRDFYIKDFGPGLTHKEVCDPQEGLYTTYFASTKSMSNDVTGAFGLGSKSPFAYTDQFTIQTARDGEKRTYMAYKGEGGVLRCDLVATEPATNDWPSGLKVSMPVSPNDFHRFRQEAEMILRWFDHPFQIVGSDVGVSNRRANAVDQLTGLEISPTGNPVCVMGNVAYTIDKYQLQSNKAYDAGDADLLQTMWYDDWVIDVPIGAVSVTPSRESLEYTDRTCRALLDALHQKYTDLIQHFESSLASVDNNLPAIMQAAFNGVQPSKKQNTYELIKKFTVTRDELKYQLLTSNSGHSFHDIFPHIEITDLSAGSVFISVSQRDRHILRKNTLHNNFSLPPLKFNAIWKFFVQSNPNTKRIRDRVSQDLHHTIAVFVFSPEYAQRLYDSGLFPPGSIPDIESVELPARVQSTGSSASRVRREKQPFKVTYLPIGEHHNAQPDCDVVDPTTIPAENRVFVTAKIRDGDFAKTYEGVGALSQLNYDSLKTFLPDEALPSHVVIAKLTDVNRLKQLGFVSFTKKISDWDRLLARQAAHYVDATGLTGERLTQLRLLNQDNYCRTSAGDSLLILTRKLYNTPTVFDSLNQNSPDHWLTQLMNRCAPLLNHLNDSNVQNLFKMTEIGSSLTFPTLDAALKSLEVNFDMRNPILKWFDEPATRHNLYGTDLLRLTDLFIRNNLIEHLPKVLVTELPSDKEDNA
jgi:hypothetical protein